MRVSLQPGFVLHRRLYRETSVLLNVFSKEHGVVSLVAKGVRKEKSKTAGLLQPFVPLTFSWSGRGELMLMTAVEARGVFPALSGNALFSGFYLNELLIALLKTEDQHEKLFSAYEEAVRALSERILDERILRRFELILLAELGYGIFADIVSGFTQFQENKFYRFIPETGFVVVASHDDVAGTLFSGNSLLAIAKEDWSLQSTLADAKRLMRLLITPLLGEKKIHSRLLFS